MKGKRACLVTLALLSAVSESLSLGPLFILEPLSKVEFLNTEGATVTCIAHGEPEPDIRWIYADGSDISFIPNIIEITADNSLKIYPFSNKEFRQDIHSSVYTCKATNLHGSIISHKVTIRAVVDQEYITQVYDEYAILGNTAVFRCNVPSYVSDFVEVKSWIISNDVRLSNEFQRGSKYTVLQNGNLHIRGISKTDSEYQYKCETQNRITMKTVISNKAGRLYITEPTSSVSPKINDIAEQVVITEGDIIQLSCAAQGYPPPTYRWCFRKSNNNCSDLTALNVNDKTENGLLVMKSLKELAGLYICTAYNMAGSDKSQSTVVVIGQMTVFLHPQTQTVAIGGSANFDCIINGYPIKDVVWYKDGHVMANNSNVHISRNSLSIISATKQTAGMYQCIVDNGFSFTKQATGQIRLDALPPTLAETFGYRLSQPGPSISLECGATGDPVPEIVWTLAEFPLIENSRIKISQQITKQKIISRLTINALKTEDGGIYSCMAKNRAGKVSHDEKVDVYGLPKVRPLRNKTVVASEDLILHCHVSGYPVESLVWRKGKAVLHSSSRIQIYKNGTMKILETEPVLDDGMYSCTARNQPNHYSTGRGWITILEKPYVMPWFAENIVKRGRQLRLVCATTSGSQPFQFTWLYNREKIPYQFGAVFSESADISTMKINGISHEHSGLYTCIVSNIAGNSTESTMVFVKGSPVWNVHPKSSFEVGLEQKVSISCSGKGYPHPRTVWKFGEDRNLVMLDKNSTEIHILENGSIVIVSFKKENEGLYTCTVSNGIKPDLIRKVHIKIQGAPRISPKENRIQLKFGSQARLECQGKGKGPFKVSWRKFNQLLKTNDRRYWIENVETPFYIKTVLVIKEVSRLDRGQYWCEIKNNYGMNSAVISLAVMSGKSENSDGSIWTNEFDADNTDGISENFTYTDSDIKDRQESDGVFGMTILYVIPTTTAAIILFIVLIVVCILLKRQTRCNNLSANQPDTNLRKLSAKDTTSVLMKSNDTLCKRFDHDEHSLDRRYHRIQSLQRTGKRNESSSTYDGDEIQPYATFAFGKRRNDSKNSLVELKSFT
ncbi:Uncharacterised protein at_DN1445 [Pycnogonum litorale]